MLSIWKEKSTRREILIVLLFSVLCAVFLEGVFCVSNPFLKTEIPDDAITLFPEGQYYINHYSVVGEKFIPNGNDPQLGFPLSNETIQTVYFDFPEPLENEIAIKTYYAVNGENLNEDSSLISYAEKGSTCAAVILAEANYTHLRFDIDSSFTLSRVAASRKPANLTAKVPRPNAVRIAKTAVLLFVGLGTALAWKWKVAAEGNFVGTSRGRRRRYWLKNRKISALFRILHSHGWACVLILMAALLLLRVNNSSMACYDMILPNNLDAANMITLGTPRPIRSDEYLTSGANFFHNNLNGKLSVPALDSSSSSIIVQLNNIITYLNPFFWGELFLGTEYAYSWNFLIKLFFAFYTFFRLFQIITNSIKFSILASLLLCFSPGFQWWHGPGSCGIWCGFIVLFYDFFEYEKWWKKILCAWGLVCCFSFAILYLYPAWDIPMIYMFAAILIAIYATKRKINFKKSDLCFIGCTIVFMAIIAASYLISQEDVMEAKLNTVYPGKRFITGGGLPGWYWADYLIAPFTTWKPYTVSLTNQSEISHFLHLFPIPTVIYFAKYSDFKKNKVMFSLVVFKIVCAIYMVFGVGEFIAKYTMLSYSFPQRLSVIWGLASFILLLLECRYIVPVSIKQLQTKDKIGCVFVNVCVLSFLSWVIVYQKQLVEYMGDGFCYIAAGLIIAGNLLFFGIKKAFLLVLCAATLISGVLVNPINFGTGAILDTPLAKEIRTIDETQEGKWIALNNIVLPKYVHAQGVDCLNSLSWPPRFDLFAPLDQAGKYEDIYNRYAHIILTLVDEETSFELIQGDLFQLNMNVNDLEKWDVRYVVSQGQQLKSRDNVEFEIIHHDMLDNIYIYEVNY